MLTGCRPFKGPDILMQHVMATPVPPRALRTDLPSTLESLVMQCLEKDPRRRFASFAEIVNVLDSIADGLGQRHSSIGARAAVVPLKADR